MAEIEYKPCMSRRREVSVVSFVELAALTWRERTSGEGGGKGPDVVSTLNQRAQLGPWGKLCESAVGTHV